MMLKPAKIKSETTLDSYHAYPGLETLTPESQVGL